MSTGCEHCHRDELLHLDPWWNRMVCDRCHIPAPEGSGQLGTSIRSNGSTWYGEAPGQIDALVARLDASTLDPWLAPFISDGSVPTGDGQTRPHGVHFFGNFFDHSHAFGIETDDEAVIARLRAAIAANMARPSYAAAVTDREKHDKAREEREAQMRKPSTPVKASR